MSNVNLGEDEVKSPSAESNLSIIPEAKSSKTGVSVRYVHNPEKLWFVLRASYGRALKSADILIERGIYVYVAKQYVKKLVDGKMKRVLKPLIPNFIFVYATSEEMDDVMNDPRVTTYVSYYYDHFQEVNGKNPPLTVADGEMLNFIRVTSTQSEHLLFIEADRCNFKMGETVRVIDGLFNGVVGKVARVAGQQRVVISITNLGLISTAYIPTAFLQRTE